MAASTSCLTIPQGQGQTNLAVPSVTVGVDSPNRSGPRPHVLSAAFSRLGAQFMGARAGGGCKARRCSIGLSTPVSVAHPFDRGSAVHNRYWSIIMANTATSTGTNLCPTATVTRPTLEKRVRRALAAKGHYLQKTRFGTDARIELGEYCVLDDHFIPLSADCRLPELARFLGVLADGEIIEADHQWHSVIIQFIDAGAISVPHRFDLLATTEADQESLDAISTGSLKEAVDACMRLISGWRYVNGPDGRALAFNRYNVGLMLDNYPNAGRAIAEALQSGDAHA